MAPPPELARLAEGLTDQARLDGVVGLRPGRGGRRAAVLILIEVGLDGPAILFLKRSRQLRHHAGQIAFPGGGVDPTDVDLVAAALREAEEETGLDRSGVTVLGVSPAAHVAVSGFDVSAVVGWWHAPSPVAAVDPREVETVRMIPVAELTEPRNRARVRHPSGYTGPAFRIDDWLIWGLTAHFVDGILELGGWARPWDESRTVEIPERYLTDRRDTSGDVNAH
ncbi:CoA pyrophosphatase [Microlunatus parietis]